MIEVKNLSKLFKIPVEKRNTLFDNLKNISCPVNNYEIWALKDINFKVKKGEFFGVIGENGSGKSTLLKIIARLIKPTKGSIDVHGSITPFLELGLGFHDELTGTENIYLYGSIIGLRKKEISERLGKIFSFADLPQFEHTKLKNYSSGMRVRLAFSTAIQTNPDILLVDEVLAVGDLEFQQKCFDVFRMFKKKGVTIIYVSHDLNSIKKFCDRVLLLSGGVQKDIGEPDYIADKYIYSVFRQTANKEPIERKTGYKREIEFRDKGNNPDFALIEDLKKKVNVRWGTKEIEIIKVELFDKMNRKNSLLVSGDPLTIRMHYKKNKDIKNPIFGIGIFYEDGRHCFGSNTEVDNYKIGETAKEGYVDVYIERLPMWDGDFYLNVMVHDDKHYHYDWHNKMYRFKVVKLNNYDQGLFNLKCKWKISGQEGLTG